MSIMLYMSVNWSENIKVAMGIGGEGIGDVLKEIWTITKIMRRVSSRKYWHRYRKNHHKLKNDYAQLTCSDYPGTPANIKGLLAMKTFINGQKEAEP